MSFGELYSYSRIGIGIKSALTKPISQVGFSDTWIASDNDFKFELLFWFLH